jgi:hypothetical protein
MTRVTTVRSIYSEKIEKKLQIGKYQREYLNAAVVFRLNSYIEINLNTTKIEYGRRTIKTFRILRNVTC